LTFHRTPSGLSNLHLFYGVDAIVFTEGGESYSVNEILKGKFTPSAEDIKFWRMLFSHYASGKKCHFRGVGSKASLVSLTAYVMANAVSNVFICMDRDLHHLLGHLGTIRNVLHTFGYSWENCVWTPVVVLSVFEKLNTSSVEVPQIQAEVDQAFDIARKRLRWFVYAHHVLVLNAVPGFKVESSLGAVVTKAGNPPAINTTHLRGLVRHAHSTTSGPVRVNRRLTIDPLDDCYGHLLAKFAYHFLAHLLRRYCKIRSLPIEVVTAVAIDSALGQIRANKPRNDHYSLQFSRLTW
jgi:hypothetical protein